MAAVVVIGIGIYFLAFHGRQSFSIGTISSVDGDTFDFHRTRGAALPCGEDQVRVRLLGIDAPEKCDKDPCLCDWWEYAKDTMEELAGGEEFRVELCLGQDENSRWLGIAYGIREKVRSLNEQLVREGCARIYKIGAKSLSNPRLPADFEERLLTAQVEAARSRAGMWGDHRYDEGIHIIAIRYWGDDERVILGNLSDLAVSVSSLVVRDRAGHSLDAAGTLTTGIGDEGSQLLLPRTSVALSSQSETWNDDGDEAFLDLKGTAVVSSERKPDYCYKGF